MFGRTPAICNGRPLKGTAWIAGILDDRGDCSSTFIRIRCTARVCSGEPARASVCVPCGSTQGRGARRIKESGEFGPHPPYPGGARGGGRVI